MRVLMSLAFIWVLVLSPSATVAADEIVATVGDRPIHRRLLNSLVDGVFNSGFRHSRVSAEQRQKVTCEQLEKLIQQNLTILGGIDKGLELPMEWAEETRTNIQDKLGKERYVAGLAAVEMTVDEHRIAIAEKRFAEHVIQQFILGSAAVSDEDVQKSYKKHGTTWSKPATIHVQHILIGVAPGSGSDTWAIRGAEAQKLTGEIKTNLDFATAARKHSSDMYRIKGGDLGWLPQGGLIAVLEDPLWKSTDGEIIGPVQSDDGYHIARVLGRRAAQEMSLEEATTMVRDMLETKKLESSKKAWFSDLRKRYPVKIVAKDLRCNL